MPDDREDDGAYAARMIRQGWTVTDGRWVHWIKRWKASELRGFPAFIRKRPEPERIVIFPKDID